MLSRELTINGYKCKIVMQSMGHLCGYVTIPEDHRYYNVNYNNIDIHVHGGLTYSDFDEETSASEIGFDCNHRMDMNPTMANNGITGGTWRNEEYLEKELKHLVKQLGEIS